MNIQTPFYHITVDGTGKSIHSTGFHMPKSEEMKFRNDNPEGWENALSNRQMKRLHNKHRRMERRQKFLNRIDKMFSGSLLIYYEYLQWLKNKARIEAQANAERVAIISRSVSNKPVDNVNKSML